MAAFVNDRTVLIMAATPRFAPPTDRGMFLTPSAAVFKVAPDGQSATPASFTFKVTLLNMSGTVAFSCSAGITPAVNGNEVTVTYANFAAVSGTITATLNVEGVVYTQVATLAKVADGASGAAGAQGVRGNVDIAAITIASIWSDTEAANALNAAGYGAPRSRDLVTLYKADRTFSVQKMYNGSVWVTVDYVYNGNLFVKGSILPEAIDTRGLTVKDGAGNIILGAGSGLSAAYAAPGTLNSALAPDIEAAAKAQFTAFKIWDFSDGVEGFTAIGATISASNGTLTVTSTGNDPIIYSPPLSFKGALYDKIRMRVKRKSGTTWDGALLYTTLNHGISGSYFRDIDDSTKTTDFVIVEWDMSALTAGGADWTGSTVTQLRIDLGTRSDDHFEIDWIAIGKYAPAPDASIVDAAAKSHFSANRTWDFSGSIDGWTPYGATLSAGPSTLTVTATGGDPIIVSPTLAINGALYDKVRMRVKRKAGIHWEGGLFYSTANHSHVFPDYYKSIPDTTSTTGFVILEWDMSTIPDWAASTITSLRFDLGSGADDVFEIDWIAIGKYGPGPATLTRDNVSTFIEAAAIRLAFIDTASIGALSALSATIGTLRTSASGARTELSDNVFKVFDGNNILRVRIGDLSL